MMENFDCLVKSALVFYRSRQFSQFCKLLFFALYTAGLVLFLVDPNHFWSNWNNFLH